MIRMRPLVAFFVLAYLGSWVVWSPWWLSLSGVGLLPYHLPLQAVRGINLLGLFAGPFAAALIVTRVTGGRTGLRRFMARFIHWRAHPWWYALALLGIPVAAGAGYLLAPGGSMVFTGGIQGAVTLAITYAVLVLGGPLQEEPGWRGFALPRLQERLPPVSAALLLGVIHCLWHAPLFTTREWDTSQGDPGQLLGFLVLVVAMSVVMSWLANGARCSLILPILGHTGVNWALPAAAWVTGQVVVDYWPAALGLTVLAVVAIVITRGRLGLQPARQSPTG